jgi:autotransporter-associated beta strand protein
MTFSRVWLAVLAFVFSVGAASAQYANTYTWTGAVNGTWELAGPPNNWTTSGGFPPGPTPNSATSRALFNNNVNTTVSLTSTVALHTLEYGSTAGAFTIGTGGTISFANTGSAAIIFNSGAGLQTINSNITLNAALALTHNSTGLHTLGGTISGAGQTLTHTSVAGSNISYTGAITLGTLNKVGAGQLTLSGANTFSITTGLDIGGGAISFNRTGNGTIAGNITGSGTFSHIGSGTTLLTGNNSGYTGAIQIAAGVVAVDGNQNGNRLAANKLVTVIGGAFEIRGVNALATGGNAIDVNLTGGALNVVSGFSTGAPASNSHAHIRNITLSSGTINLNYSGTGGAYNAESFQLNGDVTVSSGTNTIQFGSGATAANAGIGLNGTRTFTVASGATLNVNAEIANNDSAGDSLIKAGTGLMVLNSANAYSGGTTVNAGTLRVSGSGANRLVNNAGVTVNSGGTFEFGGTNATGTTTAAIELTINSGGTVQSISTTNHNHLGNTTLNGGTLTTNAGGSYDGENFQLNGNVTVGGSTASTINLTHGLALNGTRTFTVADATSGADLILQGGASGNGILQNGDGAIPAGTLTKAGAGTLSLQGTASYTGTTAINAGTFRVDTANGLLNGSGGTVSVNSGGVLAGTDGTVARAITVNSGGIIRGGDTGAIGTLNVTGATTVLGAASNGGQITTRTSGATSGGSGTGGDPFVLSTNSLLALGGTGTLNLDPTAGKFRILIENDAALASLTTYRLVLATATADTQFQRAGDGSALFSDLDFDVWGHTSANPFTGVQLVRNGTNLELTFTTVPEPGLMLGLGAGVLALGAFHRKRFA